MIERLTAKDLLSQSLKELAKEKSIDKITVKEITDNCGFSVRTFYNNFQNVPELILWNYQEKLKKVFAKDNINLSWNELIYQGIMIIVNDYEYYKNAFHTFDYRSVQLVNLLDYAESTVVDFIKLKSNKKDLSEDETTCLKVYLNGIFLYCIQWTLKEMPVSVEKLALYFTNALPDSIKKYF